MNDGLKQKQALILKYLEDLCCITSLLEENIENLTKQLKPVMYCYPAADQENEYEEIGCPVADVLFENNEKLKSLCRFVTRIQDRVQL